MDKKRKTTDLLDTEQRKKQKLDPTGKNSNFTFHSAPKRIFFFKDIALEIQKTANEANAENSSINDEEEKEVAQLANEFEGKCRKTGGNKVVKSDLEHLVLQYFDLGFNVVDEIALEGLDGITLEG